MNFVLCSLGILAILELGSQPIQAYRYTMFGFDTRSHCTKIKCVDKNSGRSTRHIICKLEPSKQCIKSGYSPLKMNFEAKLFSLMGMNGIRNRIAGRLKIANMNILHWDRSLEELARKSLFDCSKQKTICDFLFNASYPVGQTLTYSANPPRHGWYVFPIRSWYSEMKHRVSKPPKSITDLKRQYEAYEEFPQLIWPSSEFVGCAAAGLTRGYMMSCFFHPRANFNHFDESFIEGNPCSRCPVDRSTCSREFIKLCGLDAKIAAGDEDWAANLILNWNIILIGFLSLCLYNSYISFF